MSDPTQFFWFRPDRLYARGYPRGLTSALKFLPSLQAQLADEALALGAKRPLEIGPGDVPLLRAHPRPTFLDVSPTFLRQLPGERVRGSVLAAPFADRAFDLVVIADVITHIPPDRRARALDELLRVGRALFMFAPLRGVPQVSGSPVDGRQLVDHLTSRGSVISSMRQLETPETGALAIVHAVHA